MKADTEVYPTVTAESSVKSENQPCIERLGIYGGTFSPIHYGHIYAAKAFLQHIEPDKLLIMPTAVPPHKAEVVGASAEDRLAMARLAFAGLPKTEVSDFETTRQGKSYTVYTLEHFTKPNREIYLLVGTDMFLTLSRWYCSADIFRMAHIVLMRREQDRAIDGQIAALEKSYREEFGARVTVLTDIPYELSSTEVRQSLAGGKDTSPAQIPTEVLGYIRTHHLYGT